MVVDFVLWYCAMRKAGQMTIGKTHPRLLKFIFQSSRCCSLIIKWGASSRWLFGPNSAWGSRVDDHREDALHFINKSVTWYDIFHKLYCDISGTLPYSRSFVTLRAWGQNEKYFKLDSKVNRLLNFKHLWVWNWHGRSILGEYKLAKNRTSQNQFPLSNFKCHKNLWIRFLII